MSLRTLLGLGRRLIRKKTEQVTPETIRTSTVSGIPEIPTSLRSQTKALTPQTVAEQSKALTVTEPLVKGPPLISPMNNLPKTVVNTGGAPGSKLQTFEQRPLFGSTAYDRIAQKGDGMFTADEWADWLTDRGKRNFKIFGRDFEEGYIAGAKFKYDTGLAKGSHLLNKEQQVSLEELFDSNIATFDRQGNLTGGLLGAAKESGIKLPGQMLADMARLNPANRIKVIEMGIPNQLLSKVDNVVNEQLARVKSIENSLNKNVPFVPGTSPVQETDDFVVNYLDNLEDLKKGINNFRAYIKGGNISAAKDIVNNMSFTFKRLKSDATSSQKLALNKMQGEIDDVLQSASGVRTPKYREQAGYTYPGGQNYREAILVLDERIPGNNVDGGLRRNPHYSGEEFKNPLAHIRWDTRTTSDGKKAFLISEIQSDTNQGTSRFLREKGQEALNTPMRTNPYQNDVIVKYLADSRKKLSDEILGGKLRPAQIELNASKIRKLDDKIKELTKRTDTSLAKESTGEIYNFVTKTDYYPLLDRSSQVRASLSYLTDLAQKEGIDYIAIAPTNLMQRGMEPGKIKAYQEFYGYPRGNKTPGSKSLAVIPDIFKKIGKDFDTKVGVIKVSKSDVTKPYKRVDDYKVKIDGDTVYEQTSHPEVSSTNRPDFEFIPDNDLRLYTDVFSVKVSPNMVSRQKLYKKEGGFISKYN